MSAPIISAIDYWNSGDVCGGDGDDDGGGGDGDGGGGGGAGGAGGWPANIKHKGNTHDIPEANIFSLGTVLVIGMLTSKSSSHPFEIPQRWLYNAQKSKSDWLFSTQPRGLQAEKYWMLMNANFSLIK